MKFLILLFISTSVFADCLNKLPESEIVKYINATDAIVGSGITCADRPQEKCICFDGVDEWGGLVIENEMINDLDRPKFDKIDVQSCNTIEVLNPDNTVSLDPNHCSIKREVLVCSKPDYDKEINLQNLEVYCIKQIGFFKKPSGEKILSEDKVKMKAIRDAKKAEKDADKALKDAKKAAKIQSKLDIDAATNLNQLKSALKKYVDSLD